MSAPSEDGGRIVLMQGGDRRSGACSEAKENAERLPDDSQILSTVHDEVLVEVPEVKATEVRGLVQSTMIEAMATLFPQVPIEVEAGVCAHWGEK